MSMQDRMAAAQQRMQTMLASATKPVEPKKPTVRVYMGGVVTQRMIRKALGLPSQLQQWLEAKPEAGIGARCDHCQGTGRYRFHTDGGRNEKCFRCHGKGSMDANDMAFLTRRLRGGEPLSHVVSAATA